MVRRFALGLFVCLPLAAAGLELVSSTPLPRFRFEVARMAAAPDGALILAGRNLIRGPLPESDDSQGAGEIVIARYEPAANRLAWVRAFGGSDVCVVQGLAVDPLGRIAVTGWTFSRDFPTPRGLPIANPSGRQVAYLAILDAAGGLGYGTLLNSARTEAYGAAFTPDGGLWTILRPPGEPGEFIFLEGIELREQQRIPAGQVVDFTVGAEGHLWILEPARLRKLSPAGEPLLLRELPAGFAAQSLTLDGGGAPWIAGAAFREIPVTGNALQKSSFLSVYWTSRDRGRTFEFTGFRPSQLEALFAHPKQPHEVFAQTASEVFHSTDAGDSWQPMGTVPSAGRIQPAPDDPAVLYFQPRNQDGADRLFVSFDRGRAWEQRSHPFYAQPALTPSANGTVYLTSAFSLHRSDDFGRSWRPVRLRDEAGADLLHSNRFFADPAHPERVFFESVLEPSRIPFRTARYSGNGGLTSFPIALPVLDGDILFHPDRPGEIYSTGPMAVSPDNGRTFTPLPAADGGIIAFSPDEGGLWTARFNGQLAYTDADRAEVTATLEGPAPQKIAVSPGGRLHFGIPWTTDAAILRLDPSDGSIDYATYFGGWGEDSATHISIAPDGSAIVTGQTRSPRLDPGGKPNSGLADGFVLWIAPDGSHRASALLGGQGLDKLSGGVPLENGEIAVFGSAGGPGFPIVDPLPGAGPASATSILARFRLTR